VLICVHDMCAKQGCEAMNNREIVNELMKLKSQCQSLINKINNGDNEVDFMNMDRETAELLTIEAFIREAPGCFSSDLVTAADMGYTLRDPAHAGLLMTAPENYTPVRIGRLLRKIDGVDTRIVNGGRRQHRVCILRDVDKYMMIPDREFYKEYNLQREQCNID